MALIILVPILQSVYTEAYSSHKRHLMSLFTPKPFFHFFNLLILFRFPKLTVYTFLFRINVRSLINPKSWRDCFPCIQLFQFTQFWSTFKICNFCNSIKDLPHRLPTQFHLTPSIFSYLINTEPSSDKGGSLEKIASFKQIRTTSKDFTNLLKTNKNKMLI